MRTGLLSVSPTRHQKEKTEKEIISVRFVMSKLIKYLTIVPRARMGSESIAHEAEGRMDY